MSKEIEEKKGKLKEAIEDLQSKTDELERLQEKRTELSSPNGGTSITAAVTHRKEVLASFVVGKASQQDLDEATMRVNELEKGAKLSDEMAEAITVAIQAAEKNISQLKTGVNAARHRLLESIYDTLKREIQEKISDRVRHAIAIRSRFGVGYTDTLTDIFGGMSIAENDSAAKKLESEFDIKF